MIMKISATKDYSWDSLYEDKNIHDLHSILFEQHGGPDVDPEDQPDPGPDGHGGGGNDDDDDDDDGDGSSGVQIILLCVSPRTTQMMMAKRNPQVWEG